MGVNVERAHQYVNAVLQGQIPACKFVVMACQRHVDDLGNDDFPYFFNTDLAERYCRLIQQFPHIKGKWAGRPLTMEPWQLFIICSVFGWVRPDGTRRFRELYVEVPRKNGKSSLAASIGLVMAFLDGEPGAEVYAGATTERQAWEVFGPARLMANRADGFCEATGAEVRARNISSLSSASKFEPVIGKPGDGASPHCAIIDEYHEHQTSDLYDTMLTGMGARVQPLLAVITTAGTNISGPCHDKRDQVIKVLNGAVKNEELFGIIYTIDDDDDWTDFSVWKKANPNFGVSVYEDFLRARLQEAKQRASRSNIIRCKHLNQWLNVNTAWMNMIAWNKCADSELSIEDFSGDDCVIGLDLASKVDIASMVILFRRNEHYFAFCRHYLPEETINLPSNTHYRAWRDQGFLIETPGPIIDFSYIEDDLLDMANRYRVLEVPYDPHQATQLATRMTDEGLPMVEYRQIVLNMSEPMKELEAIVLNGRFHFTGDPVLTWMASNVVAHYDKKDNIYPNKEKRKNKIDGIVALIMALGRLMQARTDEFGSVYEERGVVVL